MPVCNNCLNDDDPRRRDDPEFRAEAWLEVAPGVFLCSRDTCAPAYRGSMFRSWKAGRWVV